MRDFKAGDKAVHFKRGFLSEEELKKEPNKYIYEIIGKATDSETGEPLMVYRAEYGEKTIFVRPYNDFFSETDIEKYPNAKQKYRFEKL